MLWCYGVAAPADVVVVVQINLPCLGISEAPGDLAWRFGLVLLLAMHRSHYRPIYVFVFLGTAGAPRSKHRVITRSDRFVFKGRPLKGYW